MSRAEFNHTLVEHAKAVGIDESQFRASLASDEVVQLIKWEQKVRSTPLAP